MEEIVIQTNSGITINLDVNVKSVIYVKKKNVFEILLHVIVKMKKFSKCYERFSNYLRWSYICGVERRIAKSEGCKTK